MYADMYAGMGTDATLHMLHVRVTASSYLTIGQSLGHCAIDIAYTSSDLSL